MKEHTNVKNVIKNFDVWKIKHNGIVVMTEKSITFMKREDAQIILDTMVITIIDGKDFATIVI